MNICVNPSCSNVETFNDDRCPICHDVMSVDTGTYMSALNDRDSATELLQALHIVDAEWVQA